MAKRITKRFNDVQEAELELFKANFHILNDSEAIDFAISFANRYVKNVTELFFGETYDVILQRKRKTNKLKRKVY